MCVIHRHNLFMHCWLRACLIGCVDVCCEYVLHMFCVFVCSIIYLCCVFVVGARASSICFNVVGCMSAHDVCV